jgi:hypothetical protein
VTPSAQPSPSVAADPASAAADDGTGTTILFAAVGILAAGAAVVGLWARSRRNPVEP